MEPTSSTLNRKMGQGIRAARLSSRSVLTRTMGLAMPFTAFAILFLHANRDPVIAPPSEPSSPDTPQDHDWGLRAFTDLGLHRSDHPVDENVPPENNRDSSVERQPVKASKPLPSCVGETEVARPFLMIFMGHSGSTAIISELQKHSQTVIDVTEPVDHHEYARNTSLALAYTRELFNRGKREGKVAGFKMRPWHIKENAEAWIALTREFGARIIWQHRQNILKQAVGEYSYRFLRDESAVEGLKSRDELAKRCSTGVGCRFKITDFSFFHTMLKDSLHSDLAITRAVHIILNGSTCVHELPYEDYLYDRENEMRRLQQFLGLKYETTAPSRYKATKDSLCEVVENWDELCEKFYGCHVWRHMFDDRQNDCTCKFTSGPVDYCDTLFDNQANEMPR